MKLTDKQIAALELLMKNDNVLLYGGARSGKTFVVLYYLVFRALNFERSRQLVARKFMADVHASIWLDTLPTVCRLLGLQLGVDYRLNNVTCTITFSNFSSIIFAGVDDKERVDKILGQEFCSIYINESQDIPWITVKTLMTRLSQKVAAPIKFICDLNPTSITHWTYKMFIMRVNPESMEKQNISVGCLQMNPADNKENIVDGYIESKLETLTGMHRRRFLLGEYTTNVELKVFNPPSFYKWDEFTQWVGDKWGMVRYVAGLDFGFRDADAHIILAYIPGKKDVWIIRESKIRKQSTAQLAQRIKADRAWVAENCPRADPNILTFCDTATIRYGKEGDYKKNWRELGNLYEIDNLRAAYKRDKSMGIEVLVDDIAEGRLHVPEGGIFADEIEKTIWTENEREEIERVINDDIYHPDLMDALLYPYRYLCSYGNEAMMGREELERKNAQPDAFDRFMQKQQEMKTILEYDMAGIIDEIQEDY